MNVIKIANRNIGPAYAPYIVAELSANHNGSLDKAKAIILAAKDMGADAVKLQTYTPDTLTIDSSKNDFLIKSGPWSGYKLYDLYKQAYTPFEWHKPLFEYCKEIDITCFSSPFDETAVDLLESLDCPAYKIASFEIVDIPLIKYAAKTGKPLIISTGMANQKEIEEALAAAKEGGCQEIILLHCISSYPAPIEQSNLLTVPDIAKRFGVISGLSDHTLGTVASVTAVALGASFIEKHFTLDRNDKGPDSEFSLEPKEFFELTSSTYSAWKALGEAGYARKEAEEENVIFRRSLYFVETIKKGEVITSGNMRRIRPGYGISPKYYESILGKKIEHDVYAGEPVKWTDISE